MSLNKLLKEYASEEKIRFHMPGHKGRGEMIYDPYRIDITEIPGFDDLHNANGVLKKLNDSLAGLYGANEAHILVNGSTAGVLSGIFASVGEGERILLPRNSHKSIYNAILLRKAVPVFLPSKTDENGITKPINLEDVKIIFQREKNIKATIITNPTYEGVVSNVKDIFKTAHEHSSTTITDAAHGAHFGLYEEFCDNPSNLGSDITINGLHKSLPFLTQTSSIIIDSRTKGLSERVRFFINCFETSSPSYVLLSAAESALSLIKSRGKKLFEEVIHNISLLKSKCKDLENIYISDAEHIDPLKLILTSTKHDAGLFLYDFFRNEGIEPEMYSQNYCLLMASFMNNKKDFERLFEVLRLADKALKDVKEAKMPLDLSISEPEVAVLMHKALESEEKLVDVESAEGLVCRDFVDVFPPGIPFLIPGEIIKKSHIDLVKKSKELNINIRGLKNNKIPVI